MDGEHVLKFIHNYSLLRDQNSDDINLLALKHPYFAAAQFLNYADSIQKGNADLSKTGLYKNNPLLFAQFIAECNTLKIHDHSSEKSEKKNLTEPDILTLINELPNTHPIENIRKAGAIRITNEEEQLHGNFSSKDAVGPTEVSLNEYDDKSLMVMMSFTDWLHHFKTRAKREKEEEKDKKMLRTAWQKEKLAAAIEEENEEIPEQIFKQAMDSISENSIVSESLAIILARQGKKEKAIEMYRKLSLRNPEKSTYFADRIQELTTTQDF